MNQFENQPRRNSGALKGRNVIAQGNALGPGRVVIRKSCKGETNLVTSRRAIHSVPPFQGFLFFLRSDPGLHPGLSHVAPSGL